MARRLTKLQVDEVSVVDKAANNKRFLILKQADHESPADSESVRKTGWPSLFGRGRRETAGTPGPIDGGIEMTPEDIRKSVAEAGDVLLDPVMKRLDTVEAFIAKAQLSEPPTEDPDADEDPECEDDAFIAKAITDAVAKAMEPLAQRLEVIESAAGVRKSGMEEQGAHTVRKADGSFSWEGSGLLL